MEDTCEFRMRIPLKPSWLRKDQLLGFQGARASDLPAKRASTSKAAQTTWSCSRRGGGVGSIIFRIIVGVSETPGHILMLTAFVFTINLFGSLHGFLRCHIIITPKTIISTIIIIIIIILIIIIIIITLL